MDRLTRLALAAREGDQRALEAFVAETQSDVWQLCRYLGDAGCADDLAQETYERALASIHRYRAEGPARGWILTIARRVCADHVRRNSRRRRRDRAVLDHAAAVAGSDGAPFVVRDVTGRVDLDALIGELDDDRRAAFVLTQELGLRYDEAAEILDCPVGTIRSRVSRARADLLAMLGGSPSGTESARGSTGYP